MDIKLVVIGVDGKRNKLGKCFTDKGISFKIDADGFVPVWLETYNLIGKAKLSVTDKILWADCLLLDIHLSVSILKNLYPHPINERVKICGDTVEGMVVKGINLSSNPSLDRRVGSLKAQGTTYSLRNLRG